MTAISKSGTTCSCSTSASFRRPIPLKNKNVDTGMGLSACAPFFRARRATTIRDVFSPIITKTVELPASLYSEGPDGTPHRVIADHLRPFCRHRGRRYSGVNRRARVTCPAASRRRELPLRALGQKQAFICRLQGAR